MLLKTILVPLDGSTSSEQALPYAPELARTDGGSLSLVRTVAVHPRLHLLGLSHLLPEDPSRSLNIHAYRLCAQGLVVHTAVSPGDPRGALVAEIERRKPDLVVMSTHGRSGINRLAHGSVTDTGISHGSCPFMLVRAQAATRASDAAQHDSQIGLVVMTTHGRTGLTRAVLGSGADAVVDGDHLPVVLVHPQRAESEKTLATSGRGER